MEDTAPAQGLERIPKGIPLGNADAPFFDENGYEVAKFCCFTKRKGHVRRFIALELHVTTATSHSGQAITHPFRVYAHKGCANDVVGSPEKRLCWFFKTLQEATKLYSTLFHNKTIASGYVADTVVGRRVGSEKAPYTAEDTLPADLAQLVQRLYDEASTFLFAECNANVKALSFTETPGALSFEMLDRAEAILLDAARAATLVSPLGDEGENAELAHLSDEYVGLFASANVTVEALSGIDAVDRQLVFTQVVRDITSVREAVESGSTPLSVQYRALRCRIDAVPLEAPELASVVEQFNSANAYPAKKAHVALRRAFALHRASEAAVFASEITNRKLLFHGSRRANWLGILSRGLMMPRTVLRRAGTRTDAGMLGAGIYFSDSVGTAAKYSEASLQESFYIAAVQVAVGDAKTYTEPAPNLTGAPEPYHSCRSVKTSTSQVTAFLDSEYVIYRTNQQRLVYLLECELEQISEEQAEETEAATEEAQDDSAALSAFNGNTTADDDWGTGEGETEDGDDELQGETEASDAEQGEEEEQLEEAEEEVPRPYVGYNSDFPFSTPPPAPSYEPPPPKPNAALVDLHTGKPVTLVSAHIRARIVDFAAEVQLFHLYRNEANIAVEAQFTFPLPDFAAVSGFECYIGDRVVVAKIREKQEAHAEYAEAVNQQHGAYLLDATAVTGVFTTRVGNLPALTEALIKVTFVAELKPAAEERGIRGVVLHIPSSFAPGAVKNARPTQTATQSFAAQALGATRLTVHVGAEMADEISGVYVPRLDTFAFKRSATKACVAFHTPLGGPDLEIIVRTKQSNPSRMWVEEGAQNSFAAMLVFFPDFKPPPAEPLEVIFLLDCSASMKGAALHSAQTVLSAALNALDPRSTFNIICFGARERRLFCDPQPARYRDLRARALEFVADAKADLSVSDAASALQQLYLQTTAEGSPRAIFLFTDGFLLDESRCLFLASRHSARTRLFTFGTGSNPNRGFLLSLARAGAGEAEIVTDEVDPKDAAKGQLQRASQPSFHSLSVRWQLSETAAAAVSTAPAQLHSVFRGERLIVYGFLPRDCTQATLVAKQGTAEHTLTVYTPPAAFLKGNLIHCLAARATIEDFERGAFAPDGPAHAAAARKNRAQVLALSLKHGVLSTLTSFFAVEKRMPGVAPRGPAPLAQALAAAAVDPLPYMSWEGVPPPEISAPASDKSDGKFVLLSSLSASGVVADMDGDSHAEDRDHDKPAHTAASEAPEPAAQKEAPSSHSAHPHVNPNSLRQSHGGAPASDGVLMRFARVVPSRGSLVPPASAAKSSGGGKKHGGLGGVSTSVGRTGGAAYPRTSRKQRHLVTTAGGVVALGAGGAQVLLSLRNCRPGSYTSQADLAPRTSPFGLTAYPAPEALSDSHISWVLRGPLNVGGTCWLDAAVALLLLIAPVRTAVLNAPPYREPPSSPAYNPSPVLPALQTLLRFWFETDTRAHDFHKKISPLIEKLWRGMGELGLRYAENQSAADATAILLSHFTARGLAPRSIALGQCKGTSLSCDITVAYKPEFLVLLRSDSPALSLEAAAKEWPQYHLYAFIAFRRLQVIHATEVNHFVTVCLSREENQPWGCGYFLLDDVLLLRPGAWQGGFTACSSAKEMTTMLKELLSEVPLVVLRRKR